MITLNNPLNVDAETLFLVSKSTLVNSTHAAKKILIVLLAGPEVPSPAPFSPAVTPEAVKKMNP
jgi:hypothetical protein